MLTTRSYWVGSSVVDAVEAPQEVAPGGILALDLAHRARVVEPLSRLRCAYARVVGDAVNEHTERFWPARDDMRRSRVRRHTRPRIAVWAIVSRISAPDLVTALAPPATAELPWETAHASPPRPSASTRRAASDLRRSSSATSPGSIPLVGGSLSDDLVVDKEEAPSLGHETTEPPRHPNPWRGRCTRRCMSTSRRYEASLPPSSTVPQGMRTRPSRLALTAACARLERRPHFSPHGRRRRPRRRCRSPRADRAATSRRERIARPTRRGEPTTSPYAESLLPGRARECGAASGSVAH